MSEITMYEAQKKKMDGLCDEHDLVYRFQKDKYPITFTISPAGGMEAQISMLEGVEEVGYRSPDASMTWIFEDGSLTTMVKGGTFTIGKALRTKIESILLKMIGFWQQYFFRDIIEKGVLTNGQIPVIDEDEAKDDDLPEGAESFEELEDEEESDEESEEPAESTIAEELIAEATKLVRAENKATLGLLQRRLNIGYAAAVQLMDELEAREIVGEYVGPNTREVLPFDVPEDVEA